MAVDWNSSCNTCCTATGASNLMQQVFQEQRGLPFFPPPPAKQISYLVVSHPARVVARAYGVTPKTLRATLARRAG
jgi:hypothetical protein